MTDLTDEQKRDVHMLIHEHHFTRDEALKIVLRPKTKVRAPTIEELDQIATTRAFPRY